MKNKNLHKAKHDKNDEFYTQLPDIENELKHYEQHFENKVVLCNCDDFKISNFYLYFSRNFKQLKLKKLITTCYVAEQANLFENIDREQGTYHEYIETDKIKEEKECVLKGSGHFKGEECIDLLKQSDIVVTNPPFSLFRQYMNVLIEYNKKFLIIGSLNAVTYKNVFPLIKENIIWLGMSSPGITFKKPDGSVKHMGFAVWFTNLSHKKQNEELMLTKIYEDNEQDYPKYKNYDAIEVSKVDNIPKDYYGVMGVPINFLTKYNPDQFEILGCNRGIDQDPNGVYGRGSFIGRKESFKRLFIKRRR